MATASPPGRSIGAIPRDTAFGPVWRTRRFCPDGRLADGNGDLVAAVAAMLVDSAPE